jgi:hypothetical protein
MIVRVFHFPVGAEMVNNWPAVKELMVDSITGGLR